MSTIDDTHAQEIWYARTPCEASSYCDHKICHVCKRAIRNTSQRAAEHPGTVPGHVTGRLCDRCMVQGHQHFVKPRIEQMRRPQPDPNAFKFEGHIRLPDHEMERIEREYPADYEWFMERRKRIDDPEVRKRFYRLTNHFRDFGGDYLTDVLQEIA